MVGIGPTPVYERLPKCTHRQSEVKPNSLAPVVTRPLLSDQPMPTINFPIRRPRHAPRNIALVAFALAAVAGCSDPFALKASYANEPFVYSVYGISGSGPANAPAALDLVNRTTVRVDGSLAFDIAFDFDGTGKVVVVPQKLVGAPVSGSRVVYLQRLSGAYESNLLAPTRGWVADSTVRLLPGEVLGIKLTSASCLYQTSSDIYAKIVVDSVKTGGLIFGRGVVNPNCGFKSFETGIPTK
jgi:hypothetical protein